MSSLSLVIREASKILALTRFCRQQHFCNNQVKKLFSADKILLEGGGFLNGSFLNVGLIDEVSLVLVPIVDGASNSLTLFETSDHLQKTKPVNIFLKSVEKLDDGGLWMKYVINP